MSTDSEYACPKDVFQQLAWNMTVAHAVIKAGYESVWQHLENPPIHDLDNFISYCICWTEFVHGHHDIEDSYLFPHLEKKIDLSHEKEQHEGIDEGMDKVTAHLQEAKANYAKFDVVHIRQVMASFKDVLFAHLDEEIVNIQAERLKAFSEEELKEMVLGLETESRKRGGLTTTLPFLITHMPPEYQSYFPASLPGFVRNIIVPYIAIPFHSGWWKYSPHTLISEFSISTLLVAERPV